MSSLFSIWLSYRGSQRLNRWHLCSHTIYNRSVLSEIIDAPHTMFRFSYSYVRYWRPFVDWSHEPWYLYWKVLFWYELGLGSQKSPSPLILQGSLPCFCLMARWCISVISQNPTSTSRITVPRINRAWLDLLVWWEYYISSAWSTKIYNKRCCKWQSRLSCKAELFSTINLCHDYFEKSFSQ